MPHGAGPSDPEAEPLTRELAARACRPATALELLDAFRMDARKNRTANWDELIHYCRYSAMPVGRFVLDVHGEDPAGSGGLRRDLRGAPDHQPPSGFGKDYADLDRGYSRRTPSTGTAPRWRCSGRRRRARLSGR